MCFDDGLQYANNKCVTSVLQCCFHILFGSCRPTAGDRVTLKPHVPSWDLYSAVMHTEKKRKAYMVYHLEN